MADSSEAEDVFVKADSWSEGQEGGREAMEEGRGRVAAAAW